MKSKFCRNIQKIESYQSGIFNFEHSTPLTGLLIIDQKESKTYFTVLLF
jgi:hypothetical protein